MTNSLRSLYEKATLGEWQQRNESVSSATKDGMLPVCRGNRMSDAALIVRLHKLAPLLLEWERAQRSDVKHEEYIEAGSALLAAIRGEE